MDDSESPAATPPEDANRLPSDRLAEFVARTRVPAAATECPDPGLLAGFEEGRLAPGERDAVETHLVLCDDCRAAVAGLVADRADPSLSEQAPAPTFQSQPKPIRRLFPLVAAAAAAVLVAAVIVATNTRSAPVAGTEEALVASARDLANARPDLFGDFRPLASGESIAPAWAPKRGALALHSPAGKVLETRPEFRWEDVPGVAKWRVSLRTAEGDVLWTTDADRPSLGFPPAQAALTPGTRYIWEASGDGPLGPEGARRAFDVASGGEQKSVADANRLIDERAPAKLRPLLRAHFALRHGLYAAAERDAAQFAASEPADALGRETLETARRALGVDDPGAK